MVVEVNVVVGFLVVKGSWVFLLFVKEEGGFGFSYVCGFFNVEL